MATTVEKVGELLRAHETTYRKRQTLLGLKNTSSSTMFLGDYEYKLNPEEVVELKQLMGSWLEKQEFLYQTMEDKLNEIEKVL